MNTEDKILIAGQGGMVGSSIVRELDKQGYPNLLTPSRQEVDLTDKKEVESFFFQERPQIAIIAAAKVGGIHANNTYPAAFASENLAIALNTIDAAYKSGCDRLLFLGSSCIYPRNASQPMHEEALLTGELEKTNEAYAIAKIAGLKLCQYYRKQYGVCFHSGMPTNLYGPRDNYHPENSHVLPALIQKFHQAKEAKLPSVTLWGTGSPRREFLHVDDLAKACIHLLRLDQPDDWYNIGTGIDVSIKELAEIVKETVGFKGKINWDPSRPDGTPRKLLDIRSIQKTGWHPKIELQPGIEKTYQDFLKELQEKRLRT